MESDTSTELYIIDEDSGGKKVGLDSLSQEELIGKCKNFLQLAQKAKKAKDDLQSQLEELKTQKNEELQRLKSELESVQIKNEENEDMVKVKQRQLDRLSDDNETLLQQMDTYSSQLKAVASEKNSLEKEMSGVKKELEKCGNQSLKVMELEANIICFKEKEKEYQTKLKTLETNLEKERKSGDEAKVEIRAMKDLVEKYQVDIKDLQCQVDEKSGTNQNEKEVEESREKVEELIEINTTLNAQLGQLSTQCEDLENKVATLESSKAEEQTHCQEKIAELSAGNVSLSEERDQLKQSNEGLIEELNCLNEEMKKRGEKLEKVENFNSENIAKIRHLEKNEKDLLAEKANLEAQLSEVSDHVERLRKESDDNDTGATDELASMENKLAEKNAEIEKIMKEKLELKNVNEKLEKDSKEHLDDIKEKKEKVKSLLLELEEMKKMEVDFKQQVELEKKDTLLMKKEIAEKVESLETIRKENSTIQENLKEVKEANEALSKRLKEQSELMVGMKEQKQSKDEEKEILSKQTTDMKEQFAIKELEMKTKISELEREADLALSKCKVSLENVGVVEEEKASLQKFHDELKSENQKLLMNLEVSSAEKNKVTEDNTELSAKIETLENEIRVLKSSLEEMREETSRNRNLNMSGQQELDDSRSEVMSTSTVSRVEEHSRMKDIEDSFEERYSKLKLIAIKLKKKVADQEKVIKELDSGSRKERRPDEEPSNAVKEKLASLTKNFNNLQAQYDETVDKLESSSQELKTLKKDLETSIADNMNHKQRSEESVQQALSAKTELTRAEGELREAEGRVRSLEVTLEEERKERRALESACKDNEKVASQLQDKIGENFLIEETLQTLKLQVSQLEESLQAEQARADSAQQNLSSARLQLTQAEAELSRVKVEKEEMFLKYEKSIQSYEALQEQLASQVKSSDQTECDRKTKVNQLERQISALENNLTSRSDSLELAEAELARVSKEFENYKLRAQSVLKQSQEKGNEEQIKKKQDEIFALEKMNDALNDKLKSVGVELRTLTIERNGIQEEHERLMSRHSLLMQEIATKEKTWRDKIEQKELKIKEEKEDKAGSMERVQKSIDTLKQSHRQEIEMIKAQDTSEITKLKQQLDTSENEVIRLELVLQKEQEARRLAEESCETGGFDNRLDIREIEREACEGQEVETVVGLPQGAGITSPVPLDQLLAQADLPDTISEELRSTNTSRAAGTEKQISHMAALLAESEAQNTRLEKLTEVLKEEIRTYQRSEERHKHIENLEYVKNVILKFLTLSGSQEKARLLPVLETILKLKKEEVGQIENYIQAEENVGPNNEGWSSYLGLWSAP